MCRQCAQDKDPQMKSEVERYQETIISYVEAYYDINMVYKQKGIRQLHHEFNKQKSNRQKTYHEDSFRMNFSEHIDALASTIVFNWGRNKQDKSYYKHQFSLHIPQQSKYCSGEFLYEASNWYIINLQ